MKSTTTFFPKKKTIWLCTMLLAYSFSLHAQDALFISPTGQVTIDNSLTVNKDFETKGNAVVNKALIVNEGLIVKGNTTTAGGLSVTGGNATVTNALTAGSIISNGAVAANNGLTVRGQLTTDKFTTGSMVVTNGVIQKGTAVVTSADLGLYSSQEYSMIRMVTNKGDIGFYTSSNNANGDKPNMIIDNAGNVGIGTAENHPRAKLEINGTKSYTIKGGYHFLNRTDVGKYSPDISVDVSILASGRIVTNAEFNVYSDARIKKDLVRSDAAKDLSTLNRIQVTDYKYIDTIAHGNGHKKGVIAQEVEQVFPEAVNKGEEFVPGIFSKPAKIVAGNGTVSFTMPKPHQLMNGDIVRLITKTGIEEKKLTVTGRNSFSIEGDATQYTDVFVFGKKVHDFLMVDYDRLAMLNISATQQLSAEIELLKKQNAEQEKQIELLLQKDALSQAALTDIQSRLRSIETMQASTKR